MSKEFEGKKLLILGGNPETTPLVEIANNMGISRSYVSRIETKAIDKLAQEIKE